MVLSYVIGRFSFPSEPVKCRDPGKPQHGLLSGDTYSVGSEVTFSCEEGFRLAGVTKLTCLESGEWSHPVPYCEGGVPWKNASCNACC